MTGLDALLDNARFDAERFESAAREAQISYRALEDAAGEALDALGRFLVWAAVPNADERWSCEHGNEYTVCSVERKGDSTAVVWLCMGDHAENTHVWQGDPPCRCGLDKWHTSAFLPAWRLAQ